MKRKWSRIARRTYRALTEPAKRSERANRHIYFIMFSCKNYEKNLRKMKFYGGK